MLNRYLEISRQVEQEFERNRSLHGARMLCRAGCSQCCEQLFQITEIEAGWVSVGMQRMEAARRERLRERAASYLVERARLRTATGERETWGKLPPEGTRLACPALEDGICSIYEYRPLICRKFGMPIFNPDRPDRLMACELNFKAGEAIEDNELVQIQTGLHGQWKGLQRDYNCADGRREQEPVSVARAMVEDFSDCLGEDAK
ncbi:MAG: YkgJ family cysteine cluster protein [Bryobacteraceae bacterium]|nr:YkgJ family cysteine cluster protein [Bryobacteraceae bacterium]